MSAEDTVNILIVDDRPEQRLSLNAILSDLGENLVEAGSGRDALRELLQRDFAVILLDVNMPGMDGFDTAALVRQRSHSANTPIIFITAYGDDTHASRGYSLGAVDYILSPVDPEVLKTKVGVFTALYRAAREVKRQAEALRERTQRLRKLTEASLAIHSAPSIERVLEIATRTAASIVEAHQAATQLSIAQGASGSSGVACLSEKYAPWSSSDPKIVGFPAPTFADGNPIRLAHAEVEQMPGFGLRSSDLPMRGWLAAPLTAGDGRLLGSLQLSDKHSGEFTEEDEAIVLQLAQMTAIAIENVHSGELREANRMKDEFLSTLSHELRTPLQAVLTWVRLLRSDKADAAMIARGLEVIERCARAQAGLIEDVLDVSRIVAGHVRIELRPIELRKLAAAAIESVRPAAAAKEIEVRATFGSSPLAVSGDAVRLQQVLG
ncbi:MAG: response regulator, partial [Candidatus Binatia bacterium]